MIRPAVILFLSVTGALHARVTEESLQFTGVKFRVVRAAPHRVQLVWMNGKGAPYRTFDRVQAAFAREKKAVGFLMNAGIFEPGGIPSGLHIEGGKTLRPINLADAPGNFFLKPNGVCTFGTGDLEGPFIGTCTAWQQRLDAAQQSPTEGAEIWAIQSGPMLLIEGRRHPAFQAGSSSKLHRNGVGIDGKGQLVFAMTDKGEVVNFWDFAGLFLQLGCKNALFLDGEISQMSVNPDKPASSNLFGAMFVIAE